MKKMKTGDLVTREQFYEAYWCLIKEKTGRNVRFTYESAFDELNAKRSEMYGEPAFPSYKAFYMWQKRNL